MCLKGLGCFDLVCLSLEFRGLGGRLWSSGMGRVSGTIDMIDVFVYRRN